jgi:Na+(H+)/acetate symporter ActP
MAERGTLAELVAGSAAAVTLPFLLALLWGQFWRAGAILGISLALLLHVTIAIVGLTLLYQVLERLATRWPRLAVSLAALLVAVAAVTFAFALT